MTALTIVFAGTPEFSVAALDALVAVGHRVAAVYTQPDRPAGRGQKIQMSAVKAAAIRHGLHVEQPQTLRETNAVTRLAGFAPDVMIVVAYGLILPQNILAIPRLGCVNIHGSLLPRWRGAAPIQRALLAGDAQTGISIMRMEAGLDTGPVISTHPTSIATHENAASLHDRLAILGAQALRESLPKYASGALEPTPQSNDGVTYAHKIRKDEALIDWNSSAQNIDRQVRAFNPWPIAQTRWQGQQLRVWEASVLEKSNRETPGTVIKTDESGIAVATGGGQLIIHRLQLAGRKAMAATDFCHAHRLIGERLGDQSVE